MLPTYWRIEAWFSIYLINICIADHSKFKACLRRGTLSIFKAFSRHSYKFKAFSSLCEPCIICTQYIPELHNDLRVHELECFSADTLCLDTRCSVLFSGLLFLSSQCCCHLDIANSTADFTQQHQILVIAWNATHVHSQHDNTSSWQLFLDDLLTQM